MSGSTSAPRARRRDHGDEGVGFLGFNVTIPHKSAVFDLVDERSETPDASARSITVAFRGDRLCAHNTDAPGLQRAVREAFSADLKDLRILIVGRAAEPVAPRRWQCALDGCSRLVLATAPWTRPANSPRSSGTPCPERGGSSGILGVCKHAMEREARPHRSHHQPTSLWDEPGDAAVVPGRVLQAAAISSTTCQFAPRTRS